MSAQKSAREPSANHAVGPRAESRRRGVLLQDVLAVLQRSAARSMAMNWFRTLGGDLERFVQPVNKGRMATALSRVEDWMEINHPKCLDERTAIRDIRRLLEHEGR